MIDESSIDEDSDHLRQLVTSQRSHGQRRQRHTSQLAALRAHQHDGQLPLTCGRPVLPPSGARIVGGDESRPRSWPWQIALRNRNARSSRCAGALIAAQWVLTTAHCVDQLVLFLSFSLSFYKRINVQMQYYAVLCRVMSTYYAPAPVGKGQ